MEDSELTFDVAEYVQCVFDPLGTPPGVKVPHHTLGVDGMTESVKLNRSIPIVTDGAGRAVVFLTCRPEGGVYYSSGIAGVGSNVSGLYEYPPLTIPYNFPEYTWLLSLQTSESWALPKDIDAVKASYSSCRVVSFGGQFKPSQSAVLLQGNCYVRADQSRNYGVFEGPPNALGTYALVDVLCSSTIRNGLKTVAIPIAEGLRVCAMPGEGSEGFFATRICRWTDSNVGMEPLNLFDIPGPAGPAIRALGVYAQGNAGGSIWFTPQAYKNYLQEQYNTFSTIAILFEGCTPNTNIGNFELAMHLECVSVDKGIDRSQPPKQLVHPLALPAAKEVASRIPVASSLSKALSLKPLARAAGGPTSMFFSPIVDLAKNTVMGFARKLMPF